MYDIVIIGAGPAGYSAAIYAARFRLKTLVIGKVKGGLMISTHAIENWPGIKSVSGYDLMKQLEDHVKSFNIEIIEDEVKEVKKDSTFKVKTHKKEFEAKTIILATGTVQRSLDVPGEKEFQNKGVSYCATCDAAFFKDKIAAVIGGSDSAAKEALLLAEYAKKVYIIYRREKIRAEPITVETVDKNKKIEIITKSNVKEIKGDKVVKSVMLDTGKELALDGVFIEIGALPSVQLAKDLGVKLNDKQEIIIDENSATNIPGIFAAGDVTSRPFKQAITASADGVAAAFSAYEFVK